MYQPRFQIEQTEILFANYLKIDCRYILEFIQRKYQIDMDIDKLTEKTNQDKKKDAFDAIDQDLGISENAFDDLCLNMTFFDKFPLY